jgi:hypothetical protein
MITPMPSLGGLYDHLTYPLGTQVMAVLTPGHQHLAPEYARPAALSLPGSVRHLAGGALADALRFQPERRPQTAGIGWGGARHWLRVPRAGSGLVPTGGTAAFPRGRRDQLGLVAAMGEAIMKHRETNGCMNPYEHLIFDGSQYAILMNREGWSKVFDFLNTHFAKPD